MLVILQKKRNCCGRKLETEINVKNAIFLCKGHTKCSYATVVNRI